MKQWLDAMMIVVLVCIVAGVLSGCSALDMASTAMDVVAPKDEKGITVETEIVAGDKEVASGIGQSGVSSRHITGGVTTSTVGIPAIYFVVGMGGIFTLGLAGRLLSQRALAKERRRVLELTYELGLHKPVPEVKK